MNIIEQLLYEIRDEIENRTGELSSIIKRSSQIDDKYVNKIFLVAIYANWEIFIKNCINYYIQYIIVMMI